MDMATSEVYLYVKGMNISESEADEDGNEDIWDDSKLNEAYDKALRIANTEVAKRIAMATNTPEKDSSKAKKDKSSSGHTSKKSKTTKKVVWKAGMPCRAVYDVDGLEYEAFVLRIINDQECIVRFLGYDNSEIVPINTLNPTLGKNARELQLEQALNDKGDEERFTSQSPQTERMEFGSDRAPSAGSTVTVSESSFRKKKKSPNKKKRRHQSHGNGFEFPDLPPMPDISTIRNMLSVEMPMPPPPPLTMPTPDRVDSEEQAVSSMLLSWYMSGYYTGLYQGLKRARGGRRN